MHTFYKYEVLIEQYLRSILDISDVFNSNVIYCSVRVLQVEIVCNERVIHPFRTMKFIWISEWLNRVSVKYLLSSFRESVNTGKYTKLGIIVKE